MLKTPKTLNIFFLFLILLSNKALCQSLKGRIIDKQKEPIPGAYVFFHKNDKHAHSSLFGDFEIEGVSKGDTLVVSHVGYDGLSIIVDNPSREMTIVLTEKSMQLNELTITPELDAITLFTKLDLNTTPVNSSQEVLRKVPGLIIGQHAGGGKAEQLFLRGFDIDHGTDINITVDGLPVNMVSHAHGQGYADLHFLIPETIQKIDFGKGPYYADQGNFATAGFVAFETKERLKNSRVQFEYGRFNTTRTLGLFNLLNQERHSAYLATDYQLTDGPVESPQNFRRINLMSKFTTRFENDDKLSVSVSRFTSRWDASGQIPQRLIDNGTITRWGAVDDTEGGNTARTNISLRYTKKIDNDSYVKSLVYFSDYDFELYSNFTFFLLDSVNGDQIRQKENRQIFGLNSEWNRSLHSSRTDVLLKGGIGFRNDQVNGVELSHTANRRTTLQNTQLGDVYETNLYGYASAELEFGRLMVNPGLRLDFFNYNYNDFTITRYKTLTAEKSLLSPKLNILYNQSRNLQFYLKAGQGFHSNDARVAVETRGKEILPAAYGADLGLLWKLTPRLLVNTALWTLFLEQEFVYVGDAGIVEPSGRTRRSGIDLGLRYQLFRTLFFYSDVNYARGRSVDEQEGNNRIPLAPELTATGGLDVVNKNGLSGGIRFRYLADRPANEDNSIVAEGYFITDMNVNYTRQNLTFGFSIENLLNQEWKEAQFATESRLLNEAEPVEEIHFTPGTPFFIKGSIAYRF